MTWIPVKVVRDGDATVLYNLNGTVRSLNPATNSGGPYHWEERPAGADGAYERCTPGNGTVAYSPLTTDILVYGFKESVPNWPAGTSAITIEPLE